MPKSTVAAIITQAERNSDIILLSRRSIPPFKGQWCLPGGHIDQYETSLEAVIREVKEETGLDYQPDFFNYFDEIIPKKNIHAVVLVYCGVGKGLLNPQVDEVSDLKWFALNKTLSLDLAFKHNEIIEAFRKR